MDEPFHTLAAAEYAVAGTYFANLEHPPLAKLLAGLSLRLAGARAPRFPRPFSMRTAEQPHPYLFSGDPLSPDALLLAARRPFYALFAALVLAVAGATRRWGGDVAGLLAAALLAFEPTHLAHAGILHTDLPAALGFFGTIALTLLALEKRSWGLWALAGASLGLSLATKFSAVLLVPVVAALAAAADLADRRRARQENRPPDRRPLGGLLLALGTGAAILAGCYGVAMRSMSRDEAGTAVRVFLASRDVPEATVERLAVLSRLAPSVGHYAAGLVGIERQNRTGGGVNFLRGRISPDGFWDYFFVAFGVKSALGFLLVLLAGAVALALRRARFDRPLLAFLLPALYLFLSATGSSYNIGIRHMLPAYPLLLVAALLALVRALPPRAAAVLVAAGALLQAGEVARVHPHEMSFFNALAGGPGNGAAWLNDSNLDWGQDLRRLAAALEATGRESGATVAYFGGDDPAYRLPGARVFDPSAALPGPGLYAVSSFLLCCGPEALLVRGDAPAALGYARLRRELAARGAPVGSVGYSIRLFVIPPERAPAR